MTTGDPHTTGDEYIRVTPSTEEFGEIDIQQLASLHNLTTDTESSFVTGVLPFLSNEEPITFEFIACNTGVGGAVELYYGADDHLETLYKRLRRIYPETFDLDRVHLDLRRRLAEPVEYPTETFLAELEANRLMADYEDLAVEAARELADPDPSALPPGIPDAEEANETALVPRDAGGETQTHEETTTGATFERMYQQAPVEPVDDRNPPLPRQLRAVDDPAVIDCGNEYVVVAPPESLPSNRDEWTDLEGPTATGHGTVVARPALSETNPGAVRWQGDGDRSRDWMTAIDIVPERQTANDDRWDDDPPNRGTVLASLIETLHNAESPTAFQTVWKPKPDWSGEAESRRSDLKHNRDTRLQRLVSIMLGNSQENDGETTHSSAVAKRLELIDAKTPKRTFTVNIRAVSLPSAAPGSEEAEESIHPDAARTTEALSSVLDPLDGQYYHLEPEQLSAKSSLVGSPDTPTDVLERVVDRTVSQADEIVLNARELLYLVVSPSAADVRDEVARATQATREIDHPLPRPTQAVLNDFDHGMAVGRPIDSQGNPDETPVKLPPTVLRRHYARFAASGSGKSIGTTNDVLSIHEATDGPSILVDRKGDGMCRDYLRCHYEKYGTLDDVYLFELPETVPGLSFFDIRPALAEGRQRSDAIQNIVEHFHEIMEMVMGDDAYGQAYVAKDVLSALIKSQFDYQHGQDAFSLETLIDAALQMQQEKRVPRVAADQQHIEEELTRQFEKPEQSFQTTMDAVLNRLSKLREHETIRRIFNNVPAWDEDEGRYQAGAPAFSFRTLMDEDAVVLFDLGGLRPAAQQVLSLVLLSDLWSNYKAVEINQPDPRDRQTTLIMEEAAPLAASSLLTEELIPKSRSFGLSLGFVMQFPGQVEQRNSLAYQELLNNVQTGLYSTINKQGDVGEILASHEFAPEDIERKLRTLPRGQWVADISSAAFDTQPPRPFSMQALPIPAGHPEGEQPLEGEAIDRFEQARADCVDRTADYTLPKTERRTRDARSSPGGAVGSQQNGAASSNSSPSPSPDQQSPTPSEALNSAASNAARDIDAVLGERSADDSSDPSGDGPWDGDYPDPSTDGEIEDSADAMAPSDETGETPSDSDTTDPAFTDRSEVFAKAHEINATKQGEDRYAALEELTDAARAAGIDLDFNELAGTGSEGEHSGDESTERGAQESSAEEKEMAPDSTEPLASGLPEASGTATDSKLQEADLTRDDETFLSLVLAAMNRDLGDYSLTESMTGLRERAGDPNVDLLEDRGYIESHTVSRRRYYSVCPPGREFLNQTLSTGEGIGDLGEKTPHKVGVELLRERFEQLDGVASTTIYCRLHEDTVVDVVGFDERGEVVHAGEVETASNDRAAVVDDFEKLAHLDATTWWLVSSGTVAEDVLTTLIDADRCPELPSSDLNSSTTIRRAVTDLDLAGMAELRTYRQLTSELE